MGSLFESEKHRTVRSEEVEEVDGKFVPQGDKRAASFSDQ